MRLVRFRGPHTIRRVYKNEDQRDTQLQDLTSDEQIYHTMATHKEHVPPLPEDLIAANKEWSIKIEKDRPGFLAGLNPQKPKVDMTSLSRIDLLTYEPF